MPGPHRRRAPAGGLPPASDLAADADLAGLTGQAWFGEMLQAAQGQAQAQAQGLGQAQGQAQAQAQAQGAGARGRGKRGSGLG